MTRLHWLIAGGAVLLAVAVLALLVRPAPGGLAAESDEWDPLDQADRIRVEVLNGGGRRGMARVATQQLRDREIDVVSMGNASSFGRDSSVVLDRVGRPDAAARVAAALGIERVRSEPDSSLLLDVTVLLGAEWGDEDAMEEAAGRAVDEGMVPWWDLRRLWR